MEIKQSADSALQTFAAEPHRYCTWAVSIDGVDPGAAAALRRIVGLYQAALRLPPATAEGMHNDPLKFVGRAERVVVFRS
jgi:hypothetical protein